MKRIILLLLTVLFFQPAYTQEKLNQALTDTLKPDYRNHINIPEYDPALMPLDRQANSTGVWTEVNPKVPRVDYLGIHFVNKDTGWAVGAQGAIIYSTDGGEKWIASNSPITNTLLSVKSFNSQIIIAGGFNGSIIRSTDSGLSWQIIQTGGVGNLWETEIINDSTAFMCGTDSTLLKTKNYGISWQPINTGINLNYWAIDFIDQQIGFIACDSGKILKTIDGGNSWNLINTGFNKHLYRIKALSEMHIVAGGQGTLYTFNGGITWNSSIGGGPIDAMAFLNDSIGFVAGYSSPNFIDKTTNGGQTWLALSAPDIGAFCLTFVNDSIGFNAGLNLVIKKTIDGGNTWKQKIIKDSFLNVWSISEDRAFALGSVISHGVVYKTTDGGLNWNTSLSIEQGGFNSVFFVDSLTGFVGTSSNVRIYKTTDAGGTWVSKTITGVTNFYAPIYDIYFVDNLNGFACTGGGAFLKTIDGGENWFATADNVYGLAVQFFDSLKGYVLSGTLKKTTDGGFTWYQYILPNTSPTDFYFFNELNGWFLAYGDLYKTTNGGTSWNIIQNITGIGYQYFNWINEERGFISGTKVFYTLDSGNTWNDITNEIGFPRIHLHLANEYSGYAVGGSGLIVKYIDTSYVPVELTSFSVQTNDNNCLLQWATASELNNKGFYIERKKESGIYESLCFLNGKGTTTEKNEYLYNDLNLSDGLYKYRLKQVDFDGSYKFSNEVSINILSNPELFELSQNYPNPFNPVTKITFRTGKNGNAKLTIYNLLGEKIKTLFNNYVEAGKYYEVSFEADDLSTGFYIYVLVQFNKREVRKMLYLK
jgi:photosystem II stability/assembly factor-like uncharacterized protein